jgi:hypothetical protein
MLSGRRNGAGMLLLFLARRLAIFLFVEVNHLQSSYRQVNRHSHLNPRFGFPHTELLANAKVESALRLKTDFDDRNVGGREADECAAGEDPG